MAIIPISTTYVGLDVEPYAANWAEDSAGDDVRQGNSIVPPVLCASRANVLLGAEPRTIFTHATMQAAADATGADPLLVWNSFDGIVNARRQIVRIIAVPRTAGTTGSEAYAMRYGNAYATYSMYATPILTDGPYTSVSMCGDVFEASYVVDRDDRQLDTFADGLGTYEGYTILAVTVQDEPLEELDTRYHLYCDTPALVQQTDILAGQLEEIRAAVHDIRRYSLPIVFSWSARGMTATPAAPGDATCITTQSTTYVNAFDQSVTSRSATSPGITVARQYAGAGLSTTTTCTARVYANAVGANGTVKFVGPNGSTEITVTAGAAATWLGSDANTYTLNADSAATDTGTTRNKTDLHIKVAAGGTLYLRAATAWEIYS